MFLSVFLPWDALVTSFLARKRPLNLGRDSGFDNECSTLFSVSCKFRRAVGVHSNITPASYFQLVKMGYPLPQPLQKCPGLPGIAEGAEPSEEDTI